MEKESTGDVGKEKADIFINMIYFHICIYTPQITKQLCLYIDEFIDNAPANTSIY